MTARRREFETGASEPPQGILQCDSAARLLAARVYADRAAHCLHFSARVPSGAILTCCKSLACEVRRGRLPSAANERLELRVLSPSHAKAAASFLRPSRGQAALYLSENRPSEWLRIPIGELRRYRGGSEGGQAFSRRGSSENRGCARE